MWSVHKLYFQSLAGHCLLRNIIYILYARKSFLLLLLLLWATVQSEQISLVYFFCHISESVNPNGFYLFFLHLIDTIIKNNTDMQNWWNAVPNKESK